MEGCVALLAFAVTGALLALPIISLILNAQLRGRVNAMEQKLADLNAELAAQTARTSPGNVRVPEPEVVAETEPVPVPEEAVVAPVVETVAAAPPATPEFAYPAPTAPPEPEPEPEPEIPSHVPASSPEPYVATLPTEASPTPTEPAVLQGAAAAAMEARPAPPIDSPELEDLAPAAAFEAVPGAGGEIPPGEAASQPEAPAPAVPSKPAFDVERFVGVKLFSWMAAILLVLAAMFAIKISIDQGWITAPVRMWMGFAVGIGLIILCEMKVARRYRITANAFDGAGIAILYATLFAAHDRWHLIPQAATFVLMIGVTAVAVVLSIRRDSVFIALLGLLGGFSTPALLSTGDDRPFSLFGYLLLLNAGIGWVAYKKRWPFLSLLTLVFTTIYQWVWVVRFLDGARVGIAAAIFLVFPIVAVMALWLAGRRDGDPPGELFERTAQMSAVMPLGFAIYGAAVGGYADRFAILFGFLLCVDVGLAVIAGWKRDAEPLHLFGGATTVLVFAVWSGFSYRDFAWPSIVWWVAAFVLFYAAVPALLVMIGRGFGNLGRQTTLAAPVLLFMFTVLSEIELRAVDPRLLFGVLFALVALLGFAAARYRSGTIWFIAAFFAMTAQWSWSAGYLVSSNVGEAMLWHAAFAILFVAVPVLSRFADLPLAASRAASTAPGLMIVLMLLATRGSVVEWTLGGISIVVAISIAGVAFVASQSRRYLAMFSAGLAPWTVRAS